jgi:hypothetical protein
MCPGLLVSRLLTTGHKMLTYMPRLPESTISLGGSVEDEIEFGILSRVLFCGGSPPCHAQGTTGAGFLGLPPWRPKAK